MSVVSKAVKKSIAKKARKLVVPNIKAAFNFKSGKAPKVLLAAMEKDLDGLAHFTASKANKRGLKSYKNLKASAIKNTPKAIAGVGLTAAAGYGGTKLKARRDSVLKERVKQENSFTVAGKTFTDPKIGSAKRTVAAGYKYVYGKLQRVRGK